MVDNSAVAVMSTIVQAGVTIEGIALAMLGALYAAYVQFAPGDPETGARPPILKPLKVAAYVATTYATVNAITVGGAIWWLLAPSEKLYAVLVGAFLLQLAAGPILALVLVIRFFR